MPRKKVVEETLMESNVEETLTESNVEEKPKRAPRKKKESIDDTEPPIETKLPLQYIEIPSDIIPNLFDGITDYKVKISCFEWDLTFDISLNKK